MASLSIRTLLPGCLLSSGLLHGAPAAAQLVFEPPVITDAGTKPDHLLVGDVDEDGFPDAIVSHGFFVEPPSICLGNGDGTVQLPHALAPLPPYTTVQALTDLNGDGHLDLLVTTLFFSVKVLFGDGHGAFGGELSLNPGGFIVHRAQVGDFNGDGKTDIVIRFALDDGSSRFDVALGHGNGTFDAPVNVVTGVIFGGESPLQVADLDGDGFDDIVLRYPNGFFIIRGQATLGAWTTTTVSGAWPSENMSQFVLADLNHDGRPDAITPMTIALGTPEGTFVPSLVYGDFSNATTVAVADVDRDGILDVVTGGSGAQQVSLRRGNGDGTVQLPLVVDHLPQQSDLAIADLDLDGRPDVIAVGTHDFNVATGIATLRNHTYGAGSPFLDLGFALGGSNGAPILLANGSLVAGQPYSFRIANGTPGGVAALFLGLSELGAPFKGGILFPLPTLSSGPLPLDATGGLQISGAWPNGSSGITFYMQAWMPQTGTPQGFASTSGLRAQVP
jgi:FG-GAP-like repeat